MCGSNLPFIWATPVKPKENKSAPPPVAPVMTPVEKIKYLFDETKKNIKENLPGATGKR